MKYYLIGFFALMGSFGIAALWGFIDIRWFFTIALSGVVIFFSLEVAKVRK